MHLGFLITLLLRVWVAARLALRLSIHCDHPRCSYVQSISREKDRAHSLLWAPATVCLSRAKRGQSFHTSLVHTHSRQTRRAGRTARPRWPEGEDCARLACAPCCEQEVETERMKFGWDRSLTPAGLFISAERLFLFHATVFMPDSLSWLLVSTRLFKL